MTEVFAQNQAEHNLKANEWVLSWLRRLKPGAKVLDFASGSGRHALAANELGLRVHAWDSDAKALVRLADQSKGEVEILHTDLESKDWPDHLKLEPFGFDAVIVSNYLFRPRLAFLSNLISGSGLLIYQTFTSGHETLGRPRRSDFLLERLELLKMAEATQLHVLEFQDGVVVGEDAQPKARVQRMVALKAANQQGLLQELAAWSVKI